MASEVVIQYAEKIADLTLNGTVKKGNPLAHNGTNWVHADASDAATNLYAQYIAMQSGVSGDVIKGCKGCVLYDADAPFGSANATQYVSATAGAITSTRPTADGDVIQVIGRSISTSLARVDIKAPEEWEVFLPAHTYDTTGETGLGTTDAGWVGPQVDAAAEKTYAIGRFPSGLIGALSVAQGVWNSINGSAFDNDVTVVGAYDGASNVEDTGAAITAGDWTQADTDNIIYTQDVSACFDADFLKAGRNFCLLNDPDGITGDAQFLGLYLRGFKV